MVWVIAGPYPVKIRHLCGNIEVTLSSDAKIGDPMHADNVELEI